MSMNPTSSPALASALSAQEPINMQDLFILHNSHTSIATQGLARTLFSGSTNALQESSASLLQELQTDAATANAAPLLVGGLPYRRDAACQLYQPARRLSQAQFQQLLADCSSSAQALATSGTDWQIQAQPSRSAYADAVQKAVAVLQEKKAGNLQKLVLARSLQASSKTAIDLRPLLHRLLQDSSSTAYLLPLSITSAEQAAPPAHLIGASPELLIERRGLRISSNPLAGSARKFHDAALDAQQIQNMQASAKEQHEHRLVVQAIADLLAPLCSQLKVPELPSIHATANMWHLGTRIEGELHSPEALDLNSSLALAALLHPTPAICGAPRAQAAELIEQLEPYDRGFFSGAVGWCDASGNGAWYVAIRCARVQGTQARISAGAGIVSDSVPTLEAAETRAKFNTMLHGLGLQETIATLEQQAEL